MHGKAWANMVNAVNHWIKVQGYFSRVDAVGANDMEISWNTPENTRGWVDGYDSSNLYALYNYGDAAGCPTRSYPNWTCNPPWTREDVWYVSFGVGAAYPLPLIYSRDGANAQQWALLSLYSYTQHGARMDIKGSFTQYQACQQFPDGCGTGLNNTPSQGWTQLKNRAKSRQPYCSNLNLVNRYYVAVDRFRIKCKWSDDAYLPNPGRDYPAPEDAGRAQGG